MRSAILVAFIAALIVALPAQSAVGQETVEQPQYAPGDYWTYEVSLLAIGELLGEDTESLDLSVEFTIAIQGMEDIEVGGESVAVYNATYSADVQVSGSGEFTFFETTSSLTVSGNATLEATVYLDRDGLEPLRAHGAFDLLLNLTGMLDSIQLTFEMEGEGIVDVTFEYIQDTWSFPMMEGNQGKEEFRATGENSLTIEILGEVTDTADSFTLNGTLAYKAERTESVTVPAGTFNTLVVNTTAEDEDAEGVIGYDLSYWSSQAGAPVKREFYDGSGQLQAALNLTGYRYQATERLTILGLDAIYWIPIGVGSAVIVGVLLWVLTRRGAV